MFHLHAAHGWAPGLCHCPRPAAVVVAAASVGTSGVDRRSRQSTQGQTPMLSPTPRQQGCTGFTQINSTPLDKSSSNDSCDQRPSSSSSSNAPQSPPGPTDFVPERLTKGIRNATSISALEYLWRKYQPQFNSYHFSALMQQLTRLHEQVAAGLTQTGSAQHPGQQQGPQKQRQQQQQDRSASLAELEQELGHLLDNSSSSSTGPSNSRKASAAAGASAAAAVGSRRTRSNSRGLAGLVPAIDGYEHLTSAPAAAQQQQQQQQQRQRVAWRNSQQPSQPSPAAGAAAAGRQALQPGPAWSPPGGAAGSSSSSSSSKRQQRPLVPAGMQPPGGQQQQQQARAELHSIHALALTAAAAALHPDRRRVLDHRALVMVAHNLAKMQLQDSSIMQQLLQALGPDVLPELDPQQLTNLIWAVGVSGSSAQGDSSGPYKLLLVPAALRRSGPVVPVIAAAAALVDSSSSSSHSLGGEVQPAWEQVPAVAEPAAAGMSCDDLPAAAAIDTFADAMAVSGAVSSTAAGSSNTCQPSEEWLAAAADALLQQLPKCSSQGVSMALWGFAQLGYSPADAWWEGLWPGMQGSLQQYSPQDLALLVCAVGKLGPQVPASWLSAYCSAACDVMPAMSSQQLTMCLWGLACAGATPHKAFVLLWFLSSIGLMAQATTQELSMWLYALALLRITPSPSWCSAFVEASFGSFTAPHTRPQDLVTAMWSISRLGWSPPLLYWRGLMEAASRSFSRFGPQDLANCVSAASAVDIGCISDTWLSAFIKASQARLSAFEPVQLAHTANALAVIAKPHPSAYRIIDAAWQAAFVDAARHHLVAGRFSLRNLVLVVTSLRVLRFKQAGEVQEFLADAETALAGMWAQEQQRQVLNELQAE